MFESYATGIGVVIGLMIAWAAVQSAWRKSFSESEADPDVLARRMGCQGCGCLTVCERNLLEKEKTR